VDEHDVLRAWRALFHGQEVTAETLDRANALLEGLSGESPLHVRLAQELEELQKKHHKAAQKRTAGRS
jgi:hypothetical protein